MYPLRAPYDVVTTPYLKRGGSWSCSEDSHGEGVHTGVDLAAPEGTALYAVCDGQIRHRNYGSAFGNHQFAISPDPGQAFAEGEFFYAHARKRLADGVYVKAGDWVGEVGSEGNVTGPHIHGEHHPYSKGVWNCSVHADPQPVLDWHKEDDDMGYTYDYLGKPDGVQSIGTSYEKLDDSGWDPSKSGWENTLVYLNIRPTKWADNSGTGAVRLRIIRANGDATAYHDFLILKEALEDGTTLRTYTYWEKGDGGKTHVELRCQGGLLAAEVGTRYTKKALVY